jgi:hypothetical protein
MRATRKRNQVPNRGFTADRATYFRNNGCRFFVYRPP